MLVGKEVPMESEYSRALFTVSSKLEVPLTREYVQRTLILPSSILDSTWLGLGQ